MGASLDYYRRNRAPERWSLLIEDWEDSRELLGSSHEQLVHNQSQASPLGGLLLESEEASAFLLQRSGGLELWVAPCAWRTQVLFQMGSITLEALFSERGRWARIWDDQSFSSIDQENQWIERNCDARTARRDHIQTVILQIQTASWKWFQLLIWGLQLWVALRIRGSCPAHSLDGPHLWSRGLIDWRAHQLVLLLEIQRSRAFLLSSLQPGKLESGERLLTHSKSREQGVL